MNHLNFSQNVLKWYDQFGRKNLPWQNPRDPYTTWLSELMLQQTQVKTVIPYFQRFIQFFPNIESLACAQEDCIMTLWAGLGYYSRARNMIKTAKIIYFERQNRWPNTVEELSQLPGIGQSTAAAIVSQAFNKPAPILDGNVIRVLSRYFMVEGEIDTVNTKKTLWALAHRCMPQARFADYTQAIMDLGALCCTPKKPDCTTCPLVNTCLAFKNNVIERYPQKKLRKTRATKVHYFLVLKDSENRIYLQKNPPSGIWGSLWSLPSFEQFDELTNWIQFNKLAIIDNPEKLPVIKHSFTHFHLVLHPYQFTLHSPPNNTNWFSIQDTENMGLPVPIRKIIQA